jgi:carotenoid cleavage dioxygenase-like enzyme
METTTRPDAVAGSYQSAVADEVLCVDLAVRGALPKELTGTYVRNGANPRPGSEPAHVFLGDGMLHGLRLENGRARWYRNRWVRTNSFVHGTPYVRKNGRLDLTAGPANTSVVAHAGALLALVESSLPYEVSRELETLGPYDFGGRLRTPFAAHPKRCPRTGELHGFGMKLVPGSLTYHRIDAAGALIDSRRIPVKGTTMMHDFALTDRHAIFMDLPIVFDLRRALRGKMPFRWSDTYGARLGVAVRDDPRSRVRWFAIEPCFVFHVLNAFEEDDRIVIDVVRYRELWRDVAEGFPPATLHRFTLNLATGSVGETPLDDRAVEVPRCDERRIANGYRYGYTIEAPTTLRKYDLATGTSTVHDFGAGRIPGEAVFVPADRDEDAGWLFSFVYDAASDRSDFVVLDASDVAAEPVAVVPLPVRVPQGFHGTWIAG